MNPMLFYIAGGVGAALLLVSAIMLFKLREPKKEHRPQRKAAAPTPQPVDNELLRTFRRPSQASQPEPSTTPPARRTAPPSSEQSRGNDGDFVTSALVAGATNRGRFDEREIKVR